MLKEKIGKIKKTNFFEIFYTHQKKDTINDLLVCI